MKNKCFWLFFILLSFIVTLPISWLGMEKVDFFYPIIHDKIEIEEHIQRYAPRNRMNKMGFENTSKPERVALFHEVVIAIHNGGRDLELLAYNVSSSNNVNPSSSENAQQQKVALFTDSEVTHLKDVANLLDKTKPWILLVIAIWFLCMAWVLFKRMRLPSFPELILYSSIWIVLAMLILLTGPEEIFNQLHIWAFPEENQWFFYYEDSLMSTMMKAPLLFGVISAIWCLLSILLTIILFGFIRPISQLRWEKSNEEILSNKAAL